MRGERESLHGWSLAMAVCSLAAMAVWLLAPDALSSPAMVAVHAAWTAIAFGLLFLRLGGHRRRADRVTFARTLLVAVLFAAHALDPRAAWWKVGLALLILLLDGVDGALARRDGPTERGAVFDMESDAFFLTTMAGAAHLYLGVSGLVFAVAAMRPLYVCAMAFLRLFDYSPSPNHAGTLRGRVVHVAVVAALVAGLAPIPLAVTNAAIAAAVVLIVYSYAADIARRPAGTGGE